jgi:hypothetical protein
MPGRQPHSRAPGLAIRLLISYAPSPPSAISGRRHALILIAMPDQRGSLPAIHLSSRDFLIDLGVIPGPHLKILTIAALAPSHCAYLVRLGYMFLPWASRMLELTRKPLIINMLSGYGARGVLGNINQRRSRQTAGTYGRWQNHEVRFHPNMWYYTNQLYGRIPVSTSGSSHQIGT